MSGPSIAPVHGTSPHTVGRRWFVDFYNQWPGVLRPKEHGWVDFTLIDLIGEFSPYTGSCEIGIALFGLRLTVTYVYSPVLDEKALADADETLGIAQARNNCSSRGEAVKFPWNTVNGWTVKSLANGQIVITPSYIAEPLEPGCCPVGVLTRLSLAVWVHDRLQKRGSRKP